MLRSYLTETVILFTTQDMHTAMEKAQDIDEMSQIHIKCVAKLQERAILSKDVKPIHKAVVEILDLGALFAETVGAAQNKGAGLGKIKTAKVRRKSNVLLTVDEEPSDSDTNEESERAEAPATAKDMAQRSSTEVLHMIDREFARLLPFITAGLRSVGRAGAEPMWEQLAERLAWEGKRDRV